MKEKFKKLLSFSEKKIGILTHINADLDSLCSAYALSFLFPNSIILLSDEANIPAKKFIETFNIKVKKINEINEELFGVIVVDASSEKMINIGKQKIIAVIDHHKKNHHEINAPIIIKDEEARSTCEIIGGLLENINKEQALAIATGIISDTACFKTARIQTFNILIKCLKKIDKTYEDLLLLVKPEKSIEEKIKLIEMLKHVNYKILNEKYLVAYIKVEKNKTELASVLNEISDICLVFSEENGYIKISSRAKHYCNIHLNEIMKNIGKKFGGNGGGHRKAAGAVVKEKYEIVLKTCLHEINNAINAEMAER